MIHLICPNPAVDRTLLVDQLRVSVPNRPYEVRDFPGGKSFNVAYAILREGVDEEVIVHTILGGKNGERVTQLAEEAGVQVKALSVDKNTRECNIVVATEDATIYPIYEQGFDLDEDLLSQYTQQIVSSVEAGDYVVFSGSLMKGMPDNYIAQVQEAVADKSVHFLVDTSGSALKASYDEVDARLFKINDEEFNELMGTDYQHPEEFIASLKKEVRPEIDNFIITLGGDGAVGRLAGQYFHMYLDPIEVKNPVASGDYFLGGLVKGMVSGSSQLETLKTALSYATSNCLYWYPYIDLEDVEVYRRTAHFKEY